MATAELVCVWKEGSNYYAFGKWANDFAYYAAVINTKVATLPASDATIGTDTSRPVEVSSPTNAQVALLTGSDYAISNNLNVFPGVYQVAHGVTEIGLSSHSKPSKPSRPTVSASNDTTISVSWTAPTVEQRYASDNGRRGLVLRVKYNSKTWYKIVDAENTTSTTIGGLDSMTANPGKTISVQTIYNNSDSDSGWSDAGTYTIPSASIALPVKVTGVALTAPNTSTLRAAWTASPSAEKVTQYGIQVKYGTTTKNYTSSTNSKSMSLDTNPNTAPGRTYTVKVRAQNETGWGPYSDAATHTVDTPQALPSTPTNLTSFYLTSTNSESFSSNWNDNPINDAVIDYDVSWRTSDDSGSGIVTVSEYHKTYTSANPVAPGETFQIRVRARNITGYSPWTSWVSVQKPVTKLAAPLNLAASVTGTYPAVVSVSFDAVDGATAYRLYFAITGQSTITRKLTATSHTETFQKTLEGNVVSITVASENSAGVGAQSSAVTVTLPDAPEPVQPIDPEDPTDPRPEPDPVPDPGFIPKPGIIYNINPSTSHERRFELVELTQRTCANTFGEGECNATGTRCFNTKSTCASIADYVEQGQPIYFGDAETMRRADVYVRPSVKSTYIQPQKINPGALDANAAAAGIRSGASIVLQDHPDDDYIVDPYRDEAADDVGDPGPRTEGATFWTKWLARHRYYDGLQVKIYNLTHYDQALNLAKSYTFVLNKIDGPTSNGTVTLTCVDPLRKLDTTTVPGDVNTSVIYPDIPEHDLSSAVLRTTDAYVRTPNPQYLHRPGQPWSEVPQYQLTLNLGTGQKETEYYIMTNTPYRWVRELDRLYYDENIVESLYKIVIGDEVFQIGNMYDCVFADGALAGRRCLQFEVLDRALYNTEQTEHSTNDKVQVFLSVFQNAVINIFVKILKDFAEIPPAYIDETQITNTWWRTYGQLYFHVAHRDPTTLTDVIGNICSQLFCALYWDPLDAKIRLLSLWDHQEFDYSHSQSSPRLTAEYHLLAGTVSVNEQPDLRASQIWYHYGIKQPGISSSGDEKSYNNLFVSADLQSERQDEHGSEAVKRIFADYVTNASTSADTGLVQNICDNMTLWLRNPPRKCTFSTPAYVDLKIGSQVFLDHPNIVDLYGRRSIDSWLITQKAISGDATQIDYQGIDVQGLINLGIVQWVIAPDNTPSWSSPVTLDILGYIWNDAKNYPSTYPAARIVPDAFNSLYGSLNLIASSHWSQINAGISIVTVPSQPTSLQQTSAAPTTATYEWFPPLNDGGSPVTGYICEVTAPNSTVVTKTVTTTSATFDLSGRLGDPEAYQVQVRVAAKNAQGTGEFTGWHTYDLFAEAPPSDPEDPPDEPGTPPPSKPVDRVDSTKMATPTLSVAWDAVGSNPVKNPAKIVYTTTVDTSGSYYTPDAMQYQQTTADPPNWSTKPLYTYSPYKSTLITPFKFSSDLAYKTRVRTQRTIDGAKVWSLWAEADLAAASTPGTPPGEDPKTVATPVITSVAWVTEHDPIEAGDSSQTRTILRMTDTNSVYIRPTDIEIKQVQPENPNDTIDWDSVGLLSKIISSTADISAYVLNSVGDHWDVTKDYHIRVRAKYEQPGQTVYFSPWSTVGILAKQGDVSVVPPPDPANSPTVSVGTITNTQATVSWSATTAPSGTTLLGYETFLQLASQQDTDTGTRTKHGTSTLTYTYGVFPDTQYVVRARIRYKKPQEAESKGPWSSFTHFTSKSNPQGSIPEQVQNVKLTSTLINNGVGGATVTATWDDNPSNDNVTSYRIEWHESNSTVTSYVNNLTDNTGDFTVSGNLVGSVKYINVRVQAFNATGAGQWSSTSIIKVGIDINI